jgi:hypothetical protein
MKFAGIRYFEGQHLVIPSLFLLMMLIHTVAYSQVFTSIKPGSVASSVPDSSNLKILKPDADRDDLLFIDYHPAIIWTTETDTVRNFAYIRRNFTDQLLSVWNPPGRYYPASKIYALSLDGNYYRTVKTSDRNYAFTQQMVKGPMSFYMYRIIPQTNGWIEYSSEDANNAGYTNYMIVEEKGRRGSWQQFEYFLSMAPDSNRLIKVNQGNLSAFAEKNLNDSPKARKEALKYGNQHNSKETKILLAAIMTTGMAGAIFVKNDYRWLFMMGFPLGIVVGLVNRPYTLHWDDMVRIVEMYNYDVQSKKDLLPGTGTR